MTNRTDVFLSHNWGLDELGRDNHHRVFVINRELKRIGYQTWFDSEQIVGQIHDRIAKGIEKTKCVAVFMTQKYYDKVDGDIGNDNCKLAFSYATMRQTNNRMVAIVMEPCMTNITEWKGQVGLHLGGKIYVNMSEDVEDETYMRKQMECLQKEFRSMGIQPMINNSGPISGIFF